MNSFRKALPLMLLGLGVGFAVPTAAQAQLPVDVSKVIRREIAAGSTFVGTVMPRRRVTIGSAVDGRVIDFPYRVGDAVRASGGFAGPQVPPEQQGKPVCELRTDTIRLELAAAEAELVVRKSEFEECKNGSRPEEIEAAKATLESALASRSFTKSRLDRVTKLFQQGRTVSADDFEEATSQATAAEQAYLAAVAEHKLVLEGPRKEKIAQAGARVDIQQAVVENLKSRLAKHSMHAPFDGFVVAVHTEVGAWVSQGAPVIEIVELSHIEIVASTPERFSGKIREQMPAVIRVDALSQLFQEKVSYVVPQSDVRTRTFPIGIRMENPLHNGRYVLKAGMICRITLPVEQQREVLLVPKDALVLNPGETAVYVVRAAGEGKVAEKIYVTTGAQDGAYIEVSGRLRPGDDVVVEGNERLTPGPVSITKVVDYSTGQP